MFPGDAPGPGPKLRGGQGRGVVDIKRAIPQQRHGGGQARPIVVRELAGAHVALVDAPEGRQHPHHERIGGHFHGEDEDGARAIEHERVLRQIHGKAGFHDFH